MTERSFRLPARVFGRLSAYYLVCWGIIALVMRDAFPFAIAATLAIAVYTTVPLLAFLQGGGWSFYPRAAFRLFVIRPVLYAQTSLPLVAASGVFGVLIGAAVGHPLAVARGFVLVFASALALMFIIGYV